MNDELAQYDQPIDCFCIELLTQASYSGRLSVSDKNIELQLISREQFLPISQGTPIPVLLEDSRVATLFDSLRSIPGYSAGQNYKIWKLSILANMVVIGSAAYEAATPVRSITFRFVGSDTILFSIEPAIAELAGSSETDSMKEVINVDFGGTSILRASVSDLEVHVRPRTARQLESHMRVFDAIPFVTVHFKTDMSIQRYLDDVCDVVSLFAMSMGYHSRPFDISVSSLTEIERKAQIAAGMFVGNLDVRYPWPTEPVSDRLWAGGSVLLTINPAECAATQACLKVWLERRERWRPAYQLMMNSLKFRSVISRDRLLGAMAWFESFPLAQKSADFSSKTVSALTAV